jgi:hypothetical protein
VKTSATAASLELDIEPKAAPTPLDAYQFHAAANFLFGILQDAGTRFDQDYTAFVIYAAFLVASAADTLRDVVSRRDQASYTPGMLSAHSIAQMTGIPRETVRRKCLLLEEWRLIQRLPTGQFRCPVDGVEAGALVKQFQQVHPFLSEPRHR